MTNPPTHPAPPNRFQRAVADVYADGDFSWILRDQDWKKLLDDCGDSLFTFLMIELSDSEDCDNIETALSRMKNASADIDCALDALRRLSRTSNNHATL